MHKSFANYELKTRKVEKNVRKLSKHTEHLLKMPPAGPSVEKNLQLTLIILCRGARVLKVS